jgi:uncharacterized protein with PQ loop repeat
MKERTVHQIGWAASIMSVIMYISYLDQIIHNIHGNKGSIILPIVTTINCTAWVLYASLKHQKDWPIIICSLPGIVLGTITAITVFI